jgi:Ser/Thr protein kinase RdoA (MazF antagonist)
MPGPEEDPDALRALALRALAHWSLEGAALSLHEQRENAVFRVETSRGEAYALRVHREGYHDLSELESEHDWTSALARAGLPVPQAIPTREGSAYATVAFPDSEITRHVGLVKWLPGVPLSRSLAESSGPEDVASCFDTLGRLIARLHDATSSWAPPPGFRRHAWDAQGLMGEKPFWGRFWEIRAATSAQRARLLAIRNDLLEVLSGLDRSPEVYGMIHADLNADNVLAHDGRLSIIDFDDAGFGWFVFDLAVALYDRMDAYHPAKPHFDPARDALLDGYRSVRPLSAEQTDSLRPLLLARALSILRWAEDRPESGYQAMIPLFLEIAFERAAELGLG